MIDSPLPAGDDHRGHTETASMEPQHCIQGSHTVKWHSKYLKKESRKKEQMRTHSIITSSHECNQQKAPPRQLSMLPDSLCCVKFHCVVFTATGCPGFLLSTPRWMEGKTHNTHIRSTLVAPNRNMSPSSDTTVSM